MKTIKTYLTNLPKSVKVLLLINIIFNLIFVIFDNLFNYDLNYTFGAYPTCSENFNYYRILTFMFSHSVNVIHIISNIIFFIIFGPFVSKKIGNKNTFLLYFFSGLLSFVFFNKQKNYENYLMKKDMSKIGIDVKKIKQYQNGSVKLFMIKNINDKQYEYLRYYPQTNSYLTGASGSIFSFIILFLIFSIKERKNIILIIISIFLILQEIIFYFIRDITTSGTTFGHLGGIIGGLLFFTYIRNKKRD